MRRTRLRTVAIVLCLGLQPSMSIAAFDACGGSTHPNRQSNAYRVDPANGFDKTCIKCVNLCITFVLQLLSNWYCIVLIGIRIVSHLHRIGINPDWRTCGNLFCFTKDTSQAMMSIGQVLGTTTTASMRSEQSTAAGATTQASMNRLACTASTATMSGIIEWTHPMTHLVKSQNIYKWI